METAAVAALRCGGRDILGSAIDSWHNWSRDSHWFVFTSRRGDGLYTRLYLACIDDKGNVSKPFLLPQRNPKKYYDELLDSYNTPDFTSKPVELDARAAGNNMNLKYNLMKNLMIKTWKPLLSLLFGVAVVIFWAVPSIAGTTGAGIPIIPLISHPSQ